jgi:hypothetical protein
MPSETYRTRKKCSVLRQANSSSVPGDISPAIHQAR